MDLRFNKLITSGIRNKIYIKNKFNKILNKQLQIRYIKANGRNSYGKITMKYKGGGSFSFFKKIDWLRIKYNDNYQLVSINYDNYRTGYIGLLKNKLNISKYILLPNKLKIGDVIGTLNNNNKNNLGSAKTLRCARINEKLYNLELKPGTGGKIARSAGTFIKILVKEDNISLVKLPSKKTIWLHNDCVASTGRVSNIFHKFKKLGKAGYNRYLNKRPRVRKCAKNSIDRNFNLLYSKNSESFKI
uniref:Ribosomal protein L6 n=1 Tax=Gruberia lanceolata TaxID=1978530 RepID=A0A6C0UA45_9CILI|nr:ribosomal protein L6 [Gruberia lanceolata]